jgi:hypothetical protein
MPAENCTLSHDMAPNISGITQRLSFGFDLKSGVLVCES